MTKPKLCLHAESASHFLQWEIPYFKKHFELVETPADDVILFAFGPDVLASAGVMPARFRVAMLFPGFELQPYYNLIHRFGMRRIIDESYDLVFVNPGPLEAVFGDHPKLRVCPFSVNTDAIKLLKPRTRINSLIHISSRAPKKDWKRNRDIMRMTKLKYEVFPTRAELFWNRHGKTFWKKYSKLLGMFSSKTIGGYAAHERVIKKYHQYDGFLHIAAEKPPGVDGKYTATLMEAGLTGCILFWHDTLGLGNDFETVFDLPLDPAQAAQEIRHIRDSIDVETHSRRTAEELYENINPDHAMSSRAEAIMELLT